MLENIQKLFKDSFVADSPVYDDHFFCFYDEQSKRYIAIPKSEITKREKTIIESLFTFVGPTYKQLNVTASEQSWYEFLTGSSGELPEDEGRIRFIHFYIDNKENRPHFLETVKTFFQDQTTIIWTDEKNGVIVERETVDILVPDDFYSFTEAVLSDFYFSVYFYIGRFYNLNPSIKDHYHKEQFYFLVSRNYLPRQQIFSFEISFPTVILTADGNRLFSLLKTEWEDLFQHDYELLETIKLYLENNSNASLTAKKLYLHRNSLQYRIDKFIERTSIDIKTFKGAVSVYFICLFGNADFSKTKK